MGKEEEEEEDLDNALEAQITALERGCGSHGHEFESQPISTTTTTTTLSFAFPDWGVDIFRDPKRRKPSIIRHSKESNHNPNPNPNPSPSPNPNPNPSPTSHSPRPSPNPSLGLGPAGHVYQVPDEILSRILKQLHNVADVCSALQSCRWWWSVGSQDQIWERFLHDCRPDDRTALPKWAMVKDSVLTAKVNQRVNCFYGYFWKAFEHLRLGLRSWWYLGRPDVHYSSKSVHNLLRKVTLRDWPLVYEFIGVVFSERADSIAHVLMDALVKASMENPCSYGHSSMSAKLFCGDQRNIPKESPLVLSASPVEEEERECQGLVGIEIWRHLELLWLSYKQWLKLVSSHCSDLNYAVMVERVRSTAWSTTPTIYNKGLICFRSQVLLKFGLRKVLQSGFGWLTSRNECGAASEQEVERWQFIRHLLQEVDVSDDFTLSPNSFTQVKLHRCFPMQHSHKSDFSPFA